MTITEHGYVIKWPDKLPQPETFASSRDKCWMRFCLSRTRVMWKQLGARCVPATRTISVEESK